MSAPGCILPPDTYNPERGAAGFITRVNTSESNVMPDYLMVCEQAAREAGAVLREWMGKTSIRYKGPMDMVTEADLAAQEAIRKVVLGSFPEHSLLGEEDSPAQREGHRTEYRWIADPLDGTTNYVHGVPHFAVSLALERNGVPLVGAVYDPLLEECFTAAAGEGAHLNGQPIRVSQVTQLGDALGCTGFPYDLQRDSPDLLVFLEAAFRCQSMRRMGSAALNLCYLAAGRFDVIWNFATKIWDVAAGSLLVQEAGGVVSARRAVPSCWKRPAILPPPMRRCTRNSANWLTRR